MDITQLAAQAAQLSDQMIADRCKYDLYYLCKYILGYKDFDVKVHGPLCKAVRHLIFKNNPEEAKQYEYPSDWGREEEEGMPNEEEKRAFLRWQQEFEPDLDAIHTLIDESGMSNFDIHKLAMLLLMPRGTMKSSAVTIGFTIQWHLNFSEDRVLLDSETFTKSKAFLTEIKGHYEDNEKLRDVYFIIWGIMPDARRRKDVWSTEAINLAARKRKRKEPSIDCAGIDVTKNGMHYDLGVFDDLHSEKNTKSIEQIEQVKEHYRLAYSLLDPGAASVVIGTRWDYNDTYQMIIDEEYDDFNIMTRKAESDKGELFFPDRLTHQVLQRMRKKQGPYLYSCQYLNNPVDDETATFKRENFVYITQDEMLSRRINWYGIVDPSYGGPYSDYCAMGIIGMDANSDIYVRHIVRLKMTYHEIIQKMFELDAMFLPVRWSLEVIATQKSIEYTLEQEQIKRGRNLKVHLVKARAKAKEDRIKALAPFYEQKRVHHMRGCPNLDVLENELLKFPKAKNDDVSDMLADILEIGVAPRGGDGPKGRSKKRNRELIKMLNKPRSPIVGY